jgi:Protein of unknown function (DUF3800)
MLVFIDESGDPGFKLQQGSTSHFVAVMIIFYDYKQAEDCSQAIKALQAELKFSTEFKFNKCRPEIKDLFISRVLPFQFEIWGLVIAKDKIYSENLKRNDDKFYNYFVKLLLESGAELINAKIKIDGSGDREFKRKLEKYLKNQLPKEAVKSVKFEDSKKNALVQLADMAVGAVARSYKEKPDANRWRLMLSNKIKNCWEFR